MISFLRNFFVLCGILCMTFEAMAFEEFTEEEYITYCDPIWWESADLPQVEQLVWDLFEDMESLQHFEESSIIGCEGSLLRLAAMASPYPPVIEYLADFGFPVNLDVMALANTNPNQDILLTVIREKDNPEEEPKEYSNWYLGVAGGVNLFPIMTQQGWNQDTTCYPNRRCFEEGIPSSVSGYRWTNYVDTESNGPSLEASVGYEVPNKNVRMEASVGYDTNHLNQRYKQQLEQKIGSNYTTYNENYPTTVVSHSDSDIGLIDIGSVTVNGYLDLFDFDGFEPFIGGGIGGQYVHINDIHYSSSFEDPTNPKGYIPPLSDFDSLTDGNVSDWLMLVQAHFGFNIHASERFTFGFKATASKTLGDISYKDNYIGHPMSRFHPNNEPFSYNETFSGMKKWRSLFFFNWRIEQ